MAHTALINNDLGKIPVDLMPAMIPAAVDTCTYRLSHVSLPLNFFPFGQRSLSSTRQGGVKVARSAPRSGLTLTA